MIIYVLYSMPKKTLLPLEVKPIPVPKGYVHPPPKYEQLPTHEFTMGIIAPKGAGKTTMICNMLGFYKNYFHSILVFSPTIDSVFFTNFRTKSGM